jgi:hypothetical protein
MTVAARDLKELHDMVDKTPLAMRCAVAETVLGIAVPDRT